MKSPRGLLERPRRATNYFVRKSALLRAAEEPQRLLEQEQKVLGIGRDFEILPRSPRGGRGALEVTRAARATEEP